MPDNSTLDLELILPTAQSGAASAVAPADSAQLGEEFLQQVMQSYLRYYASGDGHTARAKRYDLGYLLEFLCQGSPSTLLPVSQWTMQATKDFVDHRLSLGEAPATVSRRLATVKHFGRTLAERVPGFINPAREVKSPGVHNSKPNGLSDQDIALLREAANDYLVEKSESFQSIRNVFLLDLLLSTGLRADEVRLLYMKQLTGAWLKDVKTKGRKFRNVYLDSQVRESFESYLERRTVELEEKFPSVLALPQKDTARYPVFISTYGAKIGDPSSFALSPKSIWRIVSDFGKRARSMADEGFDGLHPHKLRHTFAHGLLDTSKDVRLVAQALGHSDVRTTMRYTERTDDELAEAIENKIRRE